MKQKKKNNDVQLNSSQKEVDKKLEANRIKLAMLGREIKEKNRLLDKLNTEMRDLRQLYQRNR